MSIFNDAAKVLLLIGVYFGSARFGLTLEAVNGFATFVWPPTAISLVALYLFGLRFWPTIAVGAFLTNYSKGAPFGAACGIGMGNALEAFLGAYALKKLIGNRTRLDRVSHVLVLVVGGAVLSTLFSATLGAGSLLFGGVISPEKFWLTWRAWWVGDGLSDLVLAPVLLVWRTPPKIWRKPTPATVLEGGAISIVLMGLTFFAFGPGSADRSSVGLLPYFIFPLLSWIAIRFDQHANSAFIFLIATLAIWGTISDEGPFHEGNLSERLYHLQVFIATVSVTGLFFGALGREKQQALDLRTQFMSVASHELKTPLTIMMGQMNIARRDLNSGALSEHPVKTEKLIHSVSRQLERLAKLIETLLDVSLLQRKQLHLEKEWVDLSDLVGEVVERFKPQVEAAGCSLQTQVAPDLKGNLDRHRIEQVVTNLLANAVKYGRGGDIGLALQAEGSSARLVVRDSGRGIAKKDQIRIFQPFERVSATEKIGGLGLGLYICKEIIEAHHGVIRVESETGHGSSFIVELPFEPTA